MNLKYVFLIFLFFFTLSCSDQHKAENAVSEFIVKWATYPESYDPIGFDSIKPFKNKYGLNFYKINHAYRIKDKSGVLKVTGHEFKLTENFSVHTDFMEEFE